MQDGHARQILEQEFNTEKRRMDIASEAFNQVMRDAGTGIPVPDSSLRIRKVADEYNSACESFFGALKRWNDFLISGIVPDDLKDKS